MKPLKSVIIIILMLLPFTSLSAMDISVGGTIWYAWWNPHVEDSMRGENNNYTKSGSFSEAYNDTFEKSPEFIAGPFIGLTFLDNWSLGLLFLGSTEYKFHSTYDVYFISAPSNIVHVDFNVAGNRYDFDSTLSYKLNQYLKVFAGYKYMMYDVTGSYIATGVSPISLDMEWENRMHGPGAGINSTIPLFSSFFIPISISVLQLKSETRQKMYYQSTGTSYSDTKINSTFKGYNISPGIGYYSESLEMSFILGGRYQYMKNEDDKRDEFYGISISALYTL